MNFILPLICFFQFFSHVVGYYKQDYYKTTQGEVTDNITSKIDGDSFGNFGQLEVSWKVFTTIDTQPTVQNSGVSLVRTERQAVGETGKGIAINYLFYMISYF